MPNMSRSHCRCTRSGACKVADFIVDGAGRLSSSIELKLPFTGPLHGSDLTVCACCGPQAAAGMLRKRCSRVAPPQSQAFPQVSAPGRIRTRDRLLRRQLLCPAELRALGDHCGRRISRLGHVRVAVCRDLPPRTAKSTNKHRLRPLPVRSGPDLAVNGRTTDIV
jgi:hypothetical protein